MKENYIFEGGQSIFGGVQRSSPMSDASRGGGGRTGGPGAAHQPQAGGGHEQGVGHEGDCAPPPHPQSPGAPNALPAPAPEPSTPLPHPPHSAHAPERG